MTVSVNTSRSSAQRCVLEMHHHQSDIDLCERVCCPFGCKWHQSCTMKAVGIKSLCGDTVSTFSLDFDIKICSKCCIFLVLKAALLRSDVTSSPDLPQGAAVAFHWLQQCA